MIREIPGTNGRYTASDDGKIYGHSGKELNTHEDRWGYLTVGIRYPGSRMKRRRFVHRLVALAFIPNPRNLPQINHKDEDKKNNRIDNLEWCTNEYNQRYGTKTRRSVASRRIQIAQLDDSMNIVHVYASAYDAARSIGTTQSNIWIAVNNRREKAKGYRWRAYPQGGFNLSSLTR